MILREVSIERLAFTCGGCGHSWSGDYDVQHVEDGHGHLRDYYFFDGVPCPDPTTTGNVLCPRCGCATLWVELTARRASTAVTDTHAGDPGATPSAQWRTAHAAAPPLPHEPPRPNSPNAAPGDAGSKHSRQREWS